MAHETYGLALRRAFGVMAAVLSMVGCTAAAPDAATNGLSNDDGGLPLIEDATSAGDWWLAPPGCEGQLSDRRISLAIASLEHGLVAALDGDGEIICVDTVEAIEAELEEIGRHDDAAELNVRFEASEMAAQMGMVDRYTGDPHPEPNDCPECGDPHPEPN